MSDTPRGRVTNVHSPGGLLIRVKNGLATIIFNSIEVMIVILLFAVAAAL